MDDSDDLPQIGDVAVAADALEGGGEPFDALLATLGRHEHVDLPAAAPRGGWRVLRRDHGLTLLGSPADDAGANWWMARLPSEPARSQDAFVHPDAFRRRPSRRERRAGLALRWPDTMLVDPDIDELAIDIVNEGDVRWRPNGDGFHASGALSRAGVAPGGLFFGFVAGRGDAAFALDPGEYARVRVTVESAAWQDLDPGAYEVHAWLVGLGLRTTSPLPIVLDEEQIERQRVRHAPRRAAPPPPGERRTHLEQRREALRAVLAAQADAARTLEIIAGATSDEAARRDLAQALDCSSTGADAVLALPLRRFRRREVEQLRGELEEVERHLERLGGG